MKRLLLALLLLTTPSWAYPEALEGFSYGSTAEEVLQRVGEPTAVEGPTLHADSNRWIWLWDFSNHGATFELESTTETQPQHVRSVTIVASSQWKLDSGLGIGSTTNEILSYYANIVRHQDSLWFATDPDSRIVTGFELNGSRVKAIFVGRR